MFNVKQSWPDENTVELIQFWASVQWKCNESNCVLPIKSTVDKAGNVSLIYLSNHSVRFLVVCLTIEEGGPPFLSLLLYYSIGRGVPPAAPGSRNKSICCFISLCLCVCNHVRSCICARGAVSPLMSVFAWEGEGRLSDSWVSWCELCWAPVVPFGQQHPPPPPGLPSPCQPL